MGRKIYLNVPWKDKDAAKAVGVRWDAKEKKNFLWAQNDADVDKVRQWLPNGSEPDANKVGSTEEELLKKWLSEGIISDVKTYENLDPVKDKSLIEKAICFGGEFEEGKVTFTNRKNAMRFSVYKEICSPVFEEIKVAPDVEEGALFIDTETTGLRKDDEIVEVGIMGATGKALYQNYFSPQKEFDKGAADVNHLTNEVLANEALFKNEWPTIRRLLLKAPAIYAYNAPFDMRLLRQTVLRYSTDVEADIAALNMIEPKAIDVRVLVKRRIVSEEGYSLQQVAKSLGSDYVEKHKALDDCYLMAWVLEKVGLDTSAFSDAVLEEVLEKDTISHVPGARSGSGAAVVCLEKLPTLIEALVANHNKITQTLPVSNNLLVIYE